MSFWSIGFQRHEEARNSTVCRRRRCRAARWRLDIVLSANPAGALRAGEHGAVDLLIGTNADEWLMYVDEDANDADVEAWLRDNAPGREAVLRARFAPVYDEIRARFGDEVPASWLPVA